MNPTPSACARPQSSSGRTRPPSAHVDDQAAAGIPPELRDADRWIVWRWNREGDRWRKPPHDPSKPRGKQFIDPFDPQCWLSLDAARRLDHRGGDGIGFSLGHEGYADLVGVDFDHCLDEQGNIIDPNVKRWVEALDSYTERTPSGDGLRVWVKGIIPAAGRRKDEAGIEVYARDRYFTVTGRRLDGTPTGIHGRQKALDALWDELFGDAGPKPKTRPNGKPNGHAGLSDDELIDKARHATDGDKFKALFDAGDTSGYGGDDSAADLALLSQLAFWFNRDAERMETIFDRSALGQRDKWRNRPDYRKRTITKAIAGCHATYTAGRNGHANGHASTSKPRSNGAGSGSEIPPSNNGHHRADNDRPAIEITHELHIVVEQGIEALTRDDALFRRGDTLGIVVIESHETVKLRPGVKLREARGSVRFLPLSEANLATRLTQCASFYHARADKNGETMMIPTRPPDWLTKAIATRGYWPGIRRLETLTGCPYVRADGTLPSPGFDEATETFYRPSGPLPSVPNRPTQEDARKAADRLYEVVHQFPFATGFDWSVWLTGLLTAIQRPAIFGPVPGIVINGNVAGVGKGLLVNLIGILVWDHNAPTYSYPSDPKEAAKVKLALALSGIAAVHFDNVTEGGFFGNSEIDSAITSTEVAGRILGQSRDSGAVSLRPCWFLTGNNVSPAKDAYRRWLVCNLVSALENPHERRDVRGDLLGWVRDHRAELLSHALTILRAHALTGRPVGDWGPLGSFEEWDPVIRGAVWFATGNDCLTTQRQAAKEMPDRLDKLALLEGWSQLPGGTDKGLTVEEALREVESNAEKYRALHSALIRISRDGKLPSIRQIGNRIRAMQRQNTGGKMFQACGEDRDGARLWRVIGT